MDGVLVVDKPVGPSSHDIVAVARRALGISRIGHTGTLDPQASGVLPLVIGQATRLARHLTAGEKEYVATLRFGVVTDTHDAAGVIIERSGMVPAAAQLIEALARYRGTFEQTPPAFSAKMVDGTRAYALARAGKAVRSTPVEVTVHALELLAFAPPLARLRVRCSAGFYIRALAHDLGQHLQSGAILDALVRTEAAGFALADAVALERLLRGPRSEVRQHVRPMEALLLDVPAAALTAEGVEWARHGRDLGPRQLAKPLATLPSRVRLFSPEGRLVGLANPAKVPGFLHPTVVFGYN